jgi:hypothetical protein
MGKLSKLYVPTLVLVLIASFALTIIKPAHPKLTLIGYVISFLMLVKLRKDFQ